MGGTPQLPSWGKVAPPPPVPASLVPGIGPNRNVCHRKWSATAAARSDTVPKLFLELQLRRMELRRMKKYMKIDKKRQKNDAK